MTTYDELLKTHPWLTFKLPRTERFPAQIWIALGEASSKCQHLAGVPLMPRYARVLHRVFLAKGVHATAAIEGNTLSEREVMAIVEGQAVAPESHKYLEQEINNVLSAVEVVLDGMLGSPKRIDIEDIKTYNRLILNGLQVSEHVVPGEFRDCDVGVWDYKAPDVKYNKILMDKFCDWMNEGFDEPSDDHKMIAGIIKAVLAHLYFAWIHPFGDGNGRTARLIEVRLLMEAGVPSPAIHLLSNHYNKTRSEYYRRLSAASKNDDVTGFLLYAINGFVEQLRTQILYVKKQQWHVSWINYIYEAFGAEKNASDKRRIRLLVALTAADGIVNLNNIRKINAEVAEIYATKAARTLIRDLNSLVDMNLVVKTTAGYRAKTESILAFLPAKLEEEEMDGSYYLDELNRALNRAESELETQSGIDKDLLVSSG